MRIESSSEFQGVVLSTVIKDTYMFTRTSRFINDTFFDKYSYKLIYKSLKYYYDKYSKLPTLTELLILISDFHNPQLGDVELIKQECQTLYDTPRYDENFVVDKITTFIRRNNVENVLKSALPKLNQGDSIAIDSLGEELMKGLNFNLGKSTSFRLSDISEISAIRRAAIGTDDNPLIIKSCMEGINQSLQFKGYKPGDLIMICLVGSTKIMTLDGKSHTIEELYEMKKKGVKKGIYTIDPYEMHKNKYCAIEPTNYEDVVLTKYINDTIKVTLDNGAVIESTPDHRFLLRSGEYVEAQNLSKDDSLMPMYKEYRRIIPENIVDKSEGYECIKDGNGRWCYTHRAVADSIPGWSEQKTHIHHKNDDHLDNDFPNLEWISRSEHMSLTCRKRLARGEVLGRPFPKGHHYGREIQKGEHLSPATEFTSDYIRNRNLKNWKDPEYREKMTAHMRQINRDPEILRRREVNRVLKAMNRLISEYGEEAISLDSYNNLSPSEGRRKPTLWNIADKFDCLAEDKSIDMKLLQENWNGIISKAKDFNHYVVSVEKIHYEEAIPVYDIINSGPYNNFAIDVGDESGIFVHNCAAPGCFTGDTKVLTLDGESHTLEELYNSECLGIYGSDKDGNISTGMYDSVQLTKYTDILMKVVVDGTAIKCTPDHQFMLRDGSYKRADQLVPGDSLMPIRREYRTAQNAGSEITTKTKGYECVVDCNSNISYIHHKVTSVEFLKLEKPVPVYDIINAGKNHNFALALSNEEGIFVHNCGKTMFMINEGANASIQGFKVLHLFLGDMKEYDGFVRYTSRYTQIPQDDIVAMPIDQQQALIRKFNLQGFFSNVVVAAYAAGEITIEEMVQEVYRLQDENHMHFDMILVDYADNLIPDSDMMYESGGNIYNKLSLLGSKNRSVILVGSQPKPSYWGEEIIPKEAAAESSRKQHVIDVMITMGMTSKGSTVGSLFLPKVRRGVEGKIIRIKTYFERAYLEAIPETDYLREKSS